MRRRRRWLFVGLVLLLGVLVGTLGEVGMRMRGRLPWRPHVAWDMTVEPGGKIFTRHDTLGFTQVPGESKVTFPDGYAFDVTNLDDGLRSTHPLDTYGDGGKDQIWVFGCSFTYGWGLNDRETFPWRLQERLRAYDVVNFAQCGYGTLQALIQLREAFETRGAPRVAVLTYAHFHDQRNTHLRRWRKGFFYYNTLGPLRQPYARLGRNGDLRIRMSSAEYKGWPLMRHSALVHSLEQKYDLLAERYVIHSDEVSKALIRTFARECEAHDTALVVAAITVGPNTARIRAFCKQEGIPVTDIAVDYSALPEYNLLPHDNHPNAAAHRVYAARIEDYLRNNLGVGGEVIGNSR